MACNKRIREDAEDVVCIRDPLPTDMLVPAVHSREAYNFERDTCNFQCPQYAIGRLQLSLVPLVIF